MVNLTKENESFPPPMPNTSQENFNPYQAPQADITPTAYFDGDVWLLDEPKRLPAGAGKEWFVEAFEVFREKIGLWIGVGFTIMLLIVLSGLVPIVGSFASGILNVFFAAGVGYMAHKQVSGDDVRFNDLFIGFQKNSMNLALIYLITFGLMVLVVIALILLGMAFGIAHSFSSDSFIMLMVFAVIGLVLFIPVFMMAWLSPILVLLHDMKPFEAMKLSFRASMANLGALTVFGLIAMLAFIVSMFLVFVGFFVFVSWMMISSYIAYRHILTEM